MVELVDTAALEAAGAMLREGSNPSARTRCCRVSIFTMTLSNSRERHMLPVMTNPDDALAVATYLNTKVTGARLDDAKATLPSRVLDSRKIRAYEAWGLITRESDVLRLTTRGRQLARASEDDKRRVLAEVVMGVRAYRIAAEWIHHGAMEVVSLTELATHWFDHIPDDLGTTTEKTIRNQAACFLGLAEGAGLGDYIIGRRGQLTRLEVDGEVLAQLVAGAELSGRSSPPHQSEGDGDGVGRAGDSEGDAPSHGAETTRPEAIAASPSVIRVFISHGANGGIVDQVKTMLEISDLAYDVVVEQESTAIPVPEKVFEAMRRCDAAVICVTADSGAERGGGSYEINPNVLIEIGAAFVLYEKRVALVWDRRIPVPSNLQGLYRCEFEGSELSWSAGMKLMKAVNEFRNLR